MRLSILFFACLHLAAQTPTKVDYPTQIKNGPIFSDAGPVGSTLQTLCAAAGTGTLAITKQWAALATQAIACNLQFAGGRIQPASGQTVTMLQNTQCPADQQCYDPSAGGSVTFVNAPSVLTPKQWGAKGDGTTVDTVAVQAALTVAKTLHGRLYFPQGQYVVTALDGGMAGSSPGPGIGYTIDGDGPGDLNGSEIICEESGASTGNCLDMSGAAYSKIQNISFHGGTSSANAPNVTILLGKITVMSVGQFSGIMSFDNVTVATFGNYGVYDQSAEQLEFHDFGCITEISTAPACVVLSRVNTAGITSTYRTLESPGDSMTAVSFSGYRSYFVVGGTYGVLLDNGADAVGSVSFSDNYISLAATWGQANGIFLSDTGTTGGRIEQIDFRNVRVEGNGGTGHNQILTSTSQYARNIYFTGVFATGVINTVPLFNFGNITLEDSRIEIDPNDVLAGSGPELINGVTTPKGVWVKTTGSMADIPWTTGTWIVAASDGTKELISQAQINSGYTEFLPVLNSTQGDLQLYKDQNPTVAIAAGLDVPGSGLTNSWNFSQFSSGTWKTLLTIDGATGHIIPAPYGSLGVPAISSCGTSPTSGGTDVYGFVTTGSGATACTITFNAAHLTGNSCVVTARSGTQPVYTLSTTVLALTTAAASSTYDYWCSK